MKYLWLDQKANLILSYVDVVLSEIVHLLHSVANIYFQQQAILMRK